MSSRASDSEKQDILMAAFGNSSNTSRYSPHKSVEEKERLSVGSAKSERSAVNFQSNQSRKSQKLSHAVEDDDECEKDECEKDDSKTEEEDDECEKDEEDDCEDEKPKSKKSQQSCKTRQSDRSRGRRQRHCNSSKGWWLWLVVAVLLIIIIGLVVYYYNQKKKCKKTSGIGAAIALFVILFIVAMVWAIWK